MDHIQNIFAQIFNQFVTVLMFPLQPANRIYLLYLATSVVIAWFVYRSIRRKADRATARDAELARGSFLRFLFPKRIWEHPSAWLDLRYFFFHKVISHFLLLGAGGAGLSAGLYLATGNGNLRELVSNPTGAQGAGILVSVVFMFIALIILDFMGWFLHYLQHKIPLLWQFHKVHHSPEVMHPLSNYREHPIDNLTYIFFNALIYGVMQGLAMRSLGYTPSFPELLGVPLLMFVFNIAGYNLRHSHIWLRWPGRWSMIFPSPAHHHVHHSRHKDHIDKNFAFMFPIWDVIFRTYHMPEDNRDVKFGIPAYDGGKEFTSCLRLYFLPFRDAYRLFRKTPGTEKVRETEKGEG